MSKSKRFSREFRLQAVQMVCKEVGIVEAARAETQKAWKKEVDKAVKAAKTKAAKTAILKDAKAVDAKAESASRDSLRLSVESVAPKFGCTTSMLYKWVELYSENYYDDDDDDDNVISLPDKNREKLLLKLKDLELNDESFEAVRKWIHATSIRRNVEHVLGSAFNETPHRMTTAERINECDQIVRAASILAKHFARFRKLGPLMHELSATYKELFSEHGDAPVVAWGTFAERVLSEALLLERVASETGKRFNRKKHKTGAPPKTDRNVLLAEWVDLLKSHTSIKRENIYEPARYAWNAYFTKPSDEVRKAEQLKKAVAAGRAKRRK